MDLRVYVLPVSGNYFPVQLALLSALSTALTLSRFKQPPPFSSIRLEKPDIAMGSSGGNICAYLGLACDWDRTKMLSRLDIFRSEAFLMEPNMLLPSFVLIPFSKSLYLNGYGFEPTFKAIFTPASICSPTSTEIWTGTYHRKSGQQRLFVNRTLETAILTPFEFSTVSPGEKPLFLGTNIDPIYAAGDRVLLAKATLASASIPWLVKPILINGEQYSDGGEAFASPFTSLADPVYDLVLQRGGKLKMIYFSSMCLTRPQLSSGSILGEIANLLNSTQACDIRIFVHVLFRLGSGPDEPISHRNLGPSDLSDIISDLEFLNKHYAILMFPEDRSENVKINLTDIRPNDIRKVVNRVENNFGCFVWSV